METTQDVTEADAEKEPREGEQGAANPAPEGGREGDFTVSLDEAFQGPLDLPLHLVKEQEVEIQDVRLADVANAYMDHVRALRDLDVLPLPLLARLVVGGDEELRRLGKVQRVRGVLVRRVLLAGRHDHLHETGVGDLRGHRVILGVGRAAVGEARSEGEGPLRLAHGDELVAEDLERVVGHALLDQRRDGRLHAREGAVLNVRTRMPRACAHGSLRVDSRWGLGTPRKDAAMDGEGGERAWTAS